MRVIGGWVWTVRLSASGAGRDQARRHARPALGVCCWWLCPDLGEMGHAADAQLDELHGVGVESEVPEEPAKAPGARQAQGSWCRMPHPDPEVEHKRHAVEGEGDIGTRQESAGRRGGCVSDQRR